MIQEEERENRPIAKPADLERLSVEDLRSHIASLEAEIRRAPAMIEAKEAHRSGLDALFGAPKS